MTSAHWEYRCWPDDTAPFRPLLDTEFRPAGTETRTDTYFLLPGRDDLMPKLRGDTRFEVKQRLAQRAGLDCWSLALSAGLPIQPEVVRRLEAWFPALWATASGFATARDLASALAGETIMLRVAKTRELYEADGLRGEFTMARTREQSAMTVAFESREEAPLREILSRLDLACLPNLTNADALRRPSLLG